MANPGYMTITGKIQGLISAGCSSPASIGNKFQAEHTDEIMLLSFNHNMSNIGNINKSTHSPIIITKAIDKSSPLLAQALSKREEIECTLRFYRVSASGQKEKFYSVSISGGVIVDLTFEVPHAIMQNDAEPQEHLAIRYRDIAWTHHTAGTSGYSSWGEEG
ncbi:Hcp family type VI secretion system effector [Pseudomonas fluorescens group sp. PF-1]|uniref:Hcp family type VI secretion system effector n=1 Tax=Pseudomonas sp. DP16D-R1 TaxID=2075551 RepID=UPI000CD08285|nr:Hcp family type VI secretion system effector [Pseudomonas sp. DP16D-R1]POA78078.1 type VI secretion system tube protein Hcp [Pseudomonas sp. DP16D-R1]